MNSSENDLKNRWNSKLRHWGTSYLKDGATPAEAPEAEVDEEGDDDGDDEDEEEDETGAQEDSDSEYTAEGDASAGRR